MNYTLEFTIPGLPKSPNSLLGAHWRIRAGHAKQWKRKVWRAVWPLKPPKPLTSAHLTLTRVSSVRPDPDGLVGAFKAVVDGLVEAGILKGDTFEVIGMPTYAWEKGVRGKGFVRVKVEQVTVEERA